VSEIDWGRGEAVVLLFSAKALWFGLVWFGFCFALPCFASFNSRDFRPSLAWESSTARLTNAILRRVRSSALLAQGPGRFGPFVFLATVSDLGFQSDLGFWSFGLEFRDTLAVRAKSLRRAV
jgi:hypothetical protein